MANILDELLSANVDILSIAQKLAPNGKIIGDEWNAVCPFHSEKTPSYYINLHTGLTHCFGCNHRGDILKDFAELNHLSLVDAKNKILNTTKVEQQQKNDNININEQLEKAKIIWNKSIPTNPMLEKYFKTRGLEFKKNENIRFYAGTTRELLQNSKDEPIKAIISKISDTQGNLKSLHITELIEKDGKVQRKNKRFFRNLPIKGNFITLGNIDNPTIAVCEGLETGLSIKKALPTLTVLVALSSSLMPNVILPTTTNTVYIFIDSDNAGRIAGEQLYKRLEQNGINTFVVAPKDDETDFNDILTKYGISQIIEDFGNAKKLEENQERENGKFTVLGKFVPRHIAKEFVKRYKIFVNEKKRLYFYNAESGLWIEDAEAIVESVLSKNILSEELNKIYAIREIIADLKRLARKDRNFPKTPLHLIPFQNGVYDLKNDALIPYEPEQYIRYKLPVKYNPSAESKDIKKFIESIVDNPIELYELIGYTFYRDYPYQKFFILYGSGGNGKSTFLNLLISILGEHNISSVTLDSIINNRFASANLYGKLANISSDEKIKHITSSAILKALTGGDYITAERKNEKSFQFRNYAKIIISSNHIPTTEDNSPAFYRRVHIIKFLKTFSGKKDKKNIINKMLQKEELEWLALQGLEALKKLLNNDFSFTNETYANSMAEKYELLSNPLKTFLGTFTTHTSYKSEFIRNSEFLEAYNIYLKQNNIAMISNIELKRKMERLGYKSKVIKFGEKTQRCWVSLGWIDSVASKLFNNNDDIIPINTDVKGNINEIPF